MVAPTLFSVADHGVRNLIRLHLPLVKCARCYDVSCDARWNLLYTYLVLIYYSCIYIYIYTIIHVESNIEIK